MSVFNAYSESETPTGFSEEETIKAKELSEDYNPTVQAERIRKSENSIQLIDNEKTQDKIVFTKDAVRFVLKIFKMVGKGAKFVETALKTNDVWLGFAQKALKQIKEIGAIGKFCIDIASLINIRKRGQLIPEEGKGKESRVSIQKEQRKITTTLVETGLGISKFVVKGARVFLEKANPIRNHLKRVASGLTVILDVWSLKKMIKETRSLAREYVEIRNAQRSVNQKLELAVSGSDKELRLRIRQVFLRSVHMRKWVEKAVGNLLEYASCFTGLVSSIGVIFVLSSSLFVLASSAAVYLFMISVVFYLGTWALDSAYFGATDLDAKDPNGEMRARLERLREINTTIQVIYKMMLNLPKIQAGKDENGRDIPTLENLLITGLSDHFDIHNINPNTYNFIEKIQELKIQEEGNLANIEKLEELEQYSLSLQRLYRRVNPLNKEDAKKYLRLDVNKLEKELIAGLKACKVVIQYNLDDALDDQTGEIDELVNRLDGKEARFIKNLAVNFCPQGRSKGVELVKDMHNDKVKKLLIV